MDGPGLIIVVIPIVTLFAGVALPFIAASRSGRGHAGGRPASAAARKRPGAEDSAPGYLYVPCVRIRYRGLSAETRRWVQEVPIVKKTAQLIYYTSDSWDRIEAVVSPGCISRARFEADTRCRQTCPRTIASLACARHGYTWEHCPHGEVRCRQGYPAGVIPIPGDRPRPGPAGRLFFATRQAAEDHLYRTGRGQARQAAPQAPPVKELRRAMADAHPDRGGTAEQFIQARRQYQAALRAARR